MRLVWGPGRSLTLAPVEVVALCVLAAVVLVVASAGGGVVVSL